MSPGREPLSPSFLCTKEAYPAPSWPRDPAPCSIAGKKYDAASYLQDLFLSLSDSHLLSLFSQELIQQTHSQLYLPLHLMQ